MCNNSYFLKTSFVAAAKIILFIVLMSGCKSKKHEINTSEVKLQLEVKRFEQELFALTPENATQNIPILEKKYGEFFRRFNENILNVGPSSDPVYVSNITAFINDPDIKTIYKDSQKEFADFNEYTAALTDAFKRYKHFFPGKVIPEVITFISGFNYAVIAADSSLAIGLDMYLGNNYKYYSMLPQLPRYQVQRMRKGFLVADAVKAWVTTEFEADSLKNQLLDQMIQEGKMLYLIDILLPGDEDSLKIGYSSAQMEWVSGNEQRVWTYFIDRKLLYSTNAIENNKYFVEGPFTTGMPKESPPKTGAWLGWQIVRAYMENNPNVTPQKLIRENDAQKILKSSKYKPGK